MTLNSRAILLSAAVLAGAFLAGAFWSYGELWPYETLQSLKSRLVPKPAPPPISHRQIATDLATLDVSSISISAFETLEPRGGGIDAFGDSVLIMSMRGEFFVYEGMGSSTPVTRLDIDVDDGHQLFQQRMEEQNLMVEGRAAYPTFTYFRFIDVVYDRESSPPSLLASHHQWHDEAQCYTLRLSRLDLDPDLPLQRQSAEADDWQTAYETAPCLSVDANLGYFPGDQSGGRIVPVGPDSVLLSVGDHGFDGWTSPAMLPQDRGNDYGKILLVQLSTGTARAVSIGHRNPQGLAVDKDGRIWSTEHGPRGGDELNLITEGSNYGWPSVTYGAQYGMTRWPASKTQNRHDGFVEPVFAWLPSIAVSNLIQVDRFLPVWDGDLLISSMNDRMLRRFRYGQDRVMFEERIVIGQRIRDLDQLDDGTIVLWTDNSEIIEIRPGISLEPDIDEFVATLPQEKRHQALNALGVCLQCHRAAPDALPDAAPNLWEVFGRRIAGTNFPGYSDALKSKSGNWDDETLNAFLSDVNGFASGSNMFFPGIKDEAVRSTVIDYLKALKQPQVANIRPPAAASDHP